VKVKILRETLKLDKDKIIWKWKNLLLPKCEKKQILWNTAIACRFNPNPNHGNINRQTGTGDLNSTRYISS